MLGAALAVGMVACGTSKPDADAGQRAPKADPTPPPSKVADEPPPSKPPSPDPTATAGFAGWKPQPQLAADLATRDCPGPFDFPPNTPSQLTDWMQQPNACTRQAIMPVYPPPSGCTGSDCPGPQWSDYEGVNPGYDCGLPYTDASARYVTGGQWAVGGSGPPPFGSCTPPSTEQGPLLGLCSQMYDSEQGCCCPYDGEGSCQTQPRFNWIVGVCQGSTCNGTYNDLPGQSLAALRPFKNLGSQLVIDYVAAYNFDTHDRTWKIAADASFNTDGRLPAYDAIRAYGGMEADQAWLGPVPGGSVQWGSGLSPIGAEGLGPLATKASTPGLEGSPAGVMFVLSTERSFNFAFYMLNQGNIDRGAGAPQCNDWNNCWGYGNGGEIDFLESPFSAPAGATDDYRRMYLNNINQIGRSFPAQQQGDASNSHANSDRGSSWETSAMMLGSDPFSTTSTPLVYVAVIDSVGVWVYRFPSATVGLHWPGLTRTTAAAKLPAAPLMHPETFQPCTDPSKSCMMFIPNCQANTWGGPTVPGNNLSADPKGARNQGCSINGEQGFCQNWFQLFTNTGQWQVTESGTWAKEAQDPVFTSVQGPKGYCTCPDGKAADPKWCIEQPWNRRMAPFQCETAYAATCAHSPPQCSSADQSPSQAG